MQEPPIQNTPLAVVRAMLEADVFSRWLGLQVLGVGEGYCKTVMVVRPDMVNGFGVLHGGVLFSMADSTFAFACNSRNSQSLALDVTITFTRPVHPGEELTAEAQEWHNGRSTGLYLITVTNEEGLPVALFKGTCFRTGRNILEEE